MLNHACELRLHHTRCVFSSASVQMLLRRLASLRVVIDFDGRFHWDPSRRWCSLISQYLITQWCFDRKKFGLSLLRQHRHSRVGGRSLGPTLKSFRGRMGGASTTHDMSNKRPRQCPLHLHRQVAGRSRVIPVTRTPRSQCDLAPACGSESSVAHPHVIYALTATNSISTMQSNARTDNKHSSLVPLGWRLR